MNKRWIWQGSAGSVIWQLMFSGDALVMGLRRYPQERRATLFCLDSATGRALCDDFVLTETGESGGLVGDGWMIGLETTHEGLLFCHTFQPGSPEHLGLWAVDLPGNAVVWRRTDLAFAANLGDSFLVYRTRVFAGFPEREYLLIDPRTGQETEASAVDTDRANQLRMEAASEQERQGILLPFAGFDESGHVERIEFGSVSVSATHRMIAAESGTVVWDSRLKVVSAALPLFEDAMAEGVPMPAFNNFLIRAGRLYYIKQNDALISVSIS